MADLSTLDTVIAMVIVLLVLSLIVQSIQSLLKKLFKLKSGVVINSMIDLFEYVDSKKLIGKKPQEFVDLMKTEYQKLGRENIRGKLMLDSISKDDFLKIVDRIIQNNPSFDKTKFDPKKLQDELNNWFDAVMQSFDERYTRNMKTIAVIVALVVVVVLNANFFTVYRNIATSDVLRASILRAGPEIQKQAAAANKPTPNVQPAPTPSVNPALANPRPSQNPSPSPSTPVAKPSPGETGTTSNKSDEQAKEDIKQNANQIQQFVNDYKGFGFSPLKPRQVSDFFNAEGDWKGSTGGQRFNHLLKVLLGWGIMTLLLSVGAPFWEDTLSSLFGVKNLLQKQTKKTNGQNGEKSPDETSKG
jgi:hypothetical protein